ncbi:hypothetical protein BDV41DRAFT_263042 [Aspergillus transmontanensis]|uniref:Uncharacterized protein n=1 Tax=Aspergillus transmontanensis TaxID=1034304 RepID=A0A5N6VXR3_9EURO|nr:hypothetical protein BDV41DRAFT_263042 [Aspergillus transmontanensis]
MTGQPAHTARIQQIRSQTQPSSSGSASSTSWPTRYFPNVAKNVGVIRSECIILYCALAFFFFGSGLSLLPQKHLH